MKKRNPQRNASMNNNKTPKESLPEDGQQEHSISHNNEIEKPRKRYK
ncbi:hypothetical protein CR194_03565 [Salipaludibacillus keqinensis]|uniref:Uncharacterized protein n=1 Tax=Salipaludibacillus keqinensis TaxID=2045207 RepID=A0A323TI99_9BACI|nr:hypothetical protein [Salipaludibacillus keqinensis]PYZ94621.1 hypothetical protein CR194_03565 [Salipaludibacillus keqinensis]